MVIDLKYVWLLFFVMVLAYAGHQAWQDRPVQTADGIVAPDAPIQYDLQDSDTIVYDDHTLTPVATFDITAKLLGKQRYRFDHTSDISPIDLSLGWGSMSDNSVIEQLDLSQSNRFFYYRYSNTPPIPQSDIARLATNVHVIPANPYIEKKIKSLRVGSVIHLHGKLVNVSGDNLIWQTSTSRTDTGQGACEIMYVQAVTVD